MRLLQNWKDLLKQKKISKVDGNMNQFNLGGGGTCMDEIILRYFGNGYVLRKFWGILSCIIKVISNIAIKIKEGNMCDSIKWQIGIWGTYLELYMMNCNF